MIFFSASFLFFSVSIMVFIFIYWDWGVPLYMIIYIVYIRGLFYGYITPKTLPLSLPAPPTKIALSLSHAQNKTYPTLLEVPSLTDVFKLDDPPPVVECAPGLDGLLAHFAPHERFDLSGRLGAEQGLRVGVIPHVEPPVVPGGFVPVVVEHDRYDPVAVLGVEGDVVPGCVGGERRGVVVVVFVGYGGEGWLGAREVGG